MCVCVCVCVCLCVISVCVYYKVEFDNPSLLAQHNYNCKLEKRKREGKRNGMRNLVGSIKGARS